VTVGEPDRRVERVERWLVVEAEVRVRAMARSAENVSIAVQQDRIDLRRAGVDGKDRAASLWKLP